MFYDGLVANLLIDSSIWSPPFQSDGFVSIFVNIPTLPSDAFIEGPNNIEWTSCCGLGDGTIFITAHRVPVSVPEPAMSVLMLSGLVMCGLVFGRKRAEEKRRSSRL